MLLLVSLEGFGYDAAARIVGTPRETRSPGLMRARAALGADGLQAARAAGRRRRAAAHLRIVK